MAGSGVRSLSSLRSLLWRPHGFSGVAVIRVLEHEDFMPGVRVYDGRGVEIFFWSSGDFDNIGTAEAS